MLPGLPFSCGIELLLMCCRRLDFSSTGWVDLFCTEITLIISMNNIPYFVNKILQSPNGLQINTYTHRHVTRNMSLACPQVDTKTCICSPLNGTFYWLLCWFWPGCQIWQPCTELLPSHNNNKLALNMNTNPCIMHLIVKIDTRNLL